MKNHTRNLVIFWVCVAAGCIALAIFARWIYVTAHDSNRTTCAAATQKYSRPTRVTRDHGCLVKYEPTDLPEWIYLEQFEEVRIGKDAA